MPKNGLLDIKNSRKLNNMNTFELRERDFGYAVMNKTLDAYVLSGYSIEELKRYCDRDHVIIEWIPRKCGFNLRVKFMGFSRRFICESGFYCIFGLHLSLSWQYRHVNGKVMYGSMR